MPNSIDHQVVNNIKKFRFEVISGALISKLEYRIGRYSIDLVHSEVAEELAGQGIGSSLVITALQHARDNGFKVIPSCPFVAAYLERHTSEWEDIAGEA
jgi:predicted GNAT family acetyltransferase